MTEHTPTPWALMGRGDIIGICKGFPQRPVAKVLGQETSDERAANIDLILKAVNNHDAFVKALEEIIRIYAHETGRERMAAANKIAKGALAAVSSPSGGE